MQFVDHFKLRDFGEKNLYFIKINRLVFTEPTICSTSVDPQGRCCVNDQNQLHQIIIQTQRKRLVQMEEEIRQKDILLQLHFRERIEILARQDVFIIERLADPTSKALYGLFDRCLQPCRQTDAPAISNPYIRSEFIINIASLEKAMGLEVRDNLHLVNALSKYLMRYCFFIMIMIRKL